MEEQTLPPPASVTAPTSWRRYATPFDCRIGLLLLILIPADFILAARFHLSGLSHYTNIWPSLVTLLVLLWYCRWRPLPKLIDTCQLTFWAILLIDVLSLLIQVAGRSPYPLADRQLGAIDARMHFQTVRLPTLAAVLNIAYGLTGLLMLSAILLPPIYGHTVVAHRYITGVVLAAIVTAVLFALVPAAGPWTTEPFQPTHRQADIAAYLTRLKSPGPVQLEPDLGGSVSFPSFHTVLAILSAAALGSIRRLRIPAWGLATLICISTITTGWHYAIDVLAGIVLSIATLWLAKHIEPDPGPTRHSR